MVRTVVVARYATVRAGLRAMLNDSVGVTVIGEATGSADLTTLAALRPEAIVVELDALDGPAILDAARALDLAVIALGEGTEGMDLISARELPGWGFLTRGADGPEVAAAIRAAAAGLVVIEPGMLTHLSHPTSPVTANETLSAREQEVLQLMAEGLPNKQIGQRLGISPHTAKFHVASVLQKLGAASRTEAVSSGMRRGLITL